MRLISLELRTETSAGLKSIESKPLVIVAVLSPSSLMCRLKNLRSAGLGTSRAPYVSPCGTKKG